MTLSLHTIKKSKTATKTRKRIGRGNASGTGTYAGKGLKGQNSRSGVSGLKKLGMRQVLLRTPKKKGFTSLKAKAQVVNLTLINTNFKKGEEISPITLFKKGLVGSSSVRVKILGNGKLEISGLKFKNVLISQSAKDQIVKLKGEII